MPPPSHAGANERTAFDIVALTASAGGLNALSTVLNDLPADFPAAIVVVQHLDPHHRSLMAEILSRRTELKVDIDEEALAVGRLGAYSEKDIKDVPPPLID
jgi:chemotaxis response regulator CheB